MRKELNVFVPPIDNFYIRTNNVLIPAIHDIKRFLGKLDDSLETLKNSIINYEENKEDFFTAMDIVYEIRVLHSDFKCIYDDDGNIIHSYNLYLRKAEDPIKYAKEYVEEIKAEPTLFKENALEEAEEFLKKCEETDILDMLLVLEDKLNPDIFVNKEYGDFISNFKSILNSFNSLAYEDRENLYSNFCVANIEENSLLEEIKRLYISYKSTEDVLEEFCDEFDWILYRFGEDELKKLASIDSEVYFNVLNIKNSCKEFLDNKTPDNAEKLIETLEKLTEEGLKLIN